VREEETLAEEEEDRWIAKRMEAALVGRELEVEERAAVVDAIEELPLTEVSAAASTV
jgi:hypothetical protein